MNDSITFPLNAMIQYSLQRQKYQKPTGKQGKALLVTNNVLTHPSMILLERKIE